MREVLRALLDLQEVDREIYRVKEELRRLPKERDRRRADLEAKRARLAEFEGETRLGKVKLKELEDLATQQRQRLRKLETEAMASRQDAASVAAYQHEIRSVKKEIGEAEEESLKLMEAAEAQEKLAAPLRAEIEADQKVFDEFMANAEQEAAAARKRMDGLLAKRKTRGVEQIEPNVLREYEQILDVRDGLALAELDNRICQGCYINVPPNVYVRLARGLELVRCQSCDRILYLRD
jgi:hypothetical protein